ncbi:probable receptor-like protein kinase At1g80640 [Tripterygium wilfordii]|uniref:probable receptor-like protein kinase At1g80640 n=1 Tax=Tripterygium wilfordii TaxID=458696 RepID=UPI0018F83D30|nr:probable receptor-like protein kinase At1g80640 [Tripterygium wilfordii]
MGTQNCQRKSVIVVIDANRSKGSIDAVDWAMKHVVRPGDTLVILGIICGIGRKMSCFPLIMGISIAGIWERLEFPGQGEVRPKELGEEIERKKEQFQSSLQPFYRQCRKNEVKLEVKLAAGFCPDKVTVEQAQISNPRWIVLDSHLKKFKLVIFGHVGCNIAVMKGKSIATWLPSKTRQTESFSRNSRRNQEAGCGNLQENEDCNTAVQESTQSAPPKSPCWYPLSWRSGFPRVFTQIELENITNGFSEESFIQESDNAMVYGGLFQETPVIVERFAENKETFWCILKILSKVRHRNIMNLVGYCCTGTSSFLLFDFPCMGSVEIQFQCDDAAKNMPWKARWCIALEIGGSLRYLHEECVDGAIAMLTVSSSDVAISHGYCSMLCNFSMARWFKVDGLTSEDKSAADVEEEKYLAVDIHDYGMFLLELIVGKSDRVFRNHNEGQSLIDWAVPLLQNGCLSEVMDPRLSDSSETELVYHMAQAALLCLKSDSGHRFSMSEVLAVVRGDQLVTSDR